MLLQQLQEVSILSHIMIDTYEQGREYLERYIQPQVYEKITVGSLDMHDPLGRMRYLLQLLNNPQNKFPSVVVSGTSGKGSTAYLIAHMLSCAGYTTGLATSPHLQKINERICISSERKLIQISDRDFVGLLNDMIPFIDQMKESAYGAPTYYEILAAMTFVYFAEKPIDIGIIEVGLEGKFDATNVLNPHVFVLTNISLDHTAILGNTVEQIAEEATHRITYLPDDGTSVVVTGVTQQSVLSLVTARAEHVHAQVTALHTDFFCTQIRETQQSTVFSFKNAKHEYADVHVNLLGKYQAENAAIAIETVLRLQNLNIHISLKDIFLAMKNAFFPGRFEVLSVKKDTHRYKIILDGAHNEAKVSSFLESLAVLYPNQKKVFLIAFKKDKDIDTLLHLIAKHADDIVVTQFTSSVDMGKNLGMDVSEIRKKIGTMKLSQQKFHFIPAAVGALDKAREVAMQKQADIIITGSLYLVGEMRELLEMNAAFYSIFITSKHSA